MCSQVSNIGPCLIPTHCEIHPDPKEAIAMYAMLSPEEAIVLYLTSRNGRLG